LYYSCLETDFSATAPNYEGRNKFKTFWEVGHISKHFGHHELSFSNIWFVTMNRGCKLFKHRVIKANYLQRNGPDPTCSQHLCETTTTKSWVFVGVIFFKISLLIYWCQCIMLGRIGIKTVLYYSFYLGSKVQTQSIGPNSSQNLLIQPKFKSKKIFRLPIHKTSDIALGWTRYWVQP
jgi:hypothetical protein